MFNCQRLAIVPATLLVLAGPIQAEKPKPVIGDETVVQFGIGGHTYLVDQEALDESSSLLSLVMGFHVSKRVMLGLRLSYTGYKLYTFQGTSQVSSRDESVISLLPLVRWRFRADDKFQPYLDIGLGASDQIYGVGERKLAFTFGLGAQYKLNDWWAIALESRGIAWGQDYTGVPGSGGDVTSSEGILCILRFI